MELRGTPERHTAFAHDDHRRQLALGYPLDRRKYVGPQDNLPREIAENKGRNTYYFLPFLLGLIGLVYQLNRDQRNFSIVLWLFVMMGIALVFYFNTSPGEPRELRLRLCGIVLRLLDLDRIRRAGPARPDRPALEARQRGDGSRGNGRRNERPGHPRGPRTGTTTTVRTARWPATSAGTTSSRRSPNSIILNYGDNDTFPLWNNQEVYGVRPDVRIMNTSYLGGEWYIDEMKTKANDAPGVPSRCPSSSTPSTTT